MQANGTLQSSLAATQVVQVMNQQPHTRPTLDVEEQKHEAIGVKVIHNAPDPRSANISLGKYHQSSLTLKILSAVVPTDEEKKVGGPTITEL